MEKELPSIFLSYASKDVNNARNLLLRLQESGSIGQVWFDKQNIEGGAIWTQVIINAIHSCDVFVVLIPTVYSRNVADECRIAMNENKPILPLFIQSVDDLKPYGLTPFQGQLVTIKLVDYNLRFKGKFVDFEMIYDNDDDDEENNTKAIVQAILHLANQTR